MIFNYTNQTKTCTWDLNTWPENTRHKGKYHCLVDLLFDWFGFDQISKADANST